MVACYGRQLLYRHTNAVNLLEFGNYSFVTYGLLIKVDKILGIERQIDIDS